MSAPRGSCLLRKSQRANAAAPQQPVAVEVTWRGYIDARVADLVNVAVVAPNGFSMYKVMLCQTPWLSCGTLRRNVGDPDRPVYVRGV